MRKAFVLLALLVAAVPGSARAAAPANDNFADATVITSVPATHPFDLREATLEANEPYSYCSWELTGTTWYRVSSADLQVLMAELRTQSWETTFSLFRGDSADALEFVTCANHVWDGRGSRIVSLFEAQPDVSYYLRLEYTNYNFEGTPRPVGALSFDVGPLADVSVDDISIERIPLQTDAGPLPLSTSRKVTVTFSNAGPDAAFVDLWADACPETFGGCGGFMWWSGTLAPGQTMKRTFRWTPAGVGDYSVSAGLWTPLSWDADDEDNYASSETYSVVGGSGFGVGLG